MPPVLKQRCVDAFEKIHERGILHGDVELHHMIIGGDGRVTIVDFQNSRALISDSSVMLLGAEAMELKLEMRRVKYKLDYEGARQKELEKRNRAETGVARLKDTADPAVDAEAWAQGWANETADAIPARFVVPGQTPATVADEVRNFLESLDDVPPLPSLRAPLLDNGPRQVRFASEIASTRIFRAASSENAILSPVDISPSRKRKLSEPLPHYNTRSSKRLRSEQLAEDDEDEAPARRGLTADPLLLQYQNADPNDRDHFTPPRSPVDEFIEGCSSQPSSSSQYPPIKTRDFAYEAYDGPKGYYTPYPLLESVMAMNRRRWIKQQAAGKRAGNVAQGEPGPSTSTTTPHSQQSLTDKHLRRLALGLGELSRPAAEARRPHASSSTAEQPRPPSFFDLPPDPSLFDPQPDPPSSSPLPKRKRGDREQEVGQDDFDEDDRLAKRARAVVRTGPNMLLPSAHSSYALPRHTARLPAASSEDQKLSHMGPRGHEFTPPPVRPSPQPRMGSKQAAVSSRLAFATLRRLAPAPNVAGMSRALPLARANGGTPAERQPERRTRRRLRSASPEPSSEDEVEAILDPSAVPASISSESSSSFAWIGFLLHWIQ